MAPIEENIRRFETLLGSVQRDGIPKLIKYIRSTIFTKLLHPFIFIWPVKAVFCSTA